MARESETSGRRWRGLHRSTIVLCLLLAALLVILIVPGQWNDVWFFSIPVSVHYEHGWPWVFLKRESTAWPMTDPNWLSGSSWTFGGVRENDGEIGHELLGFWAIWLVADAAVAVLLICGLAWYLEWRRRRRPIWQISMREWSVCALATALALGWWVNACGVGRRERTSALDRFGDTNCRFTVAGPLWIRRLVGRRLLQPTSRLEEVCLFDLDDIDFLPDYPQLRKLSLDGIRVETDAELEQLHQRLRQVSRMPRLTALSLAVGSAEMEPELDLGGLHGVERLEVNFKTKFGRVEQLPVDGRLRDLTLTNVVDFFSREHIAELQSLERLNFGTIVDADDLPLIAQLSNLRELTLFVSQVDENDLAVLRLLPKLHRLELVGNIDDRHVPPLMYVTSLQRLDLQGTTVSDRVVHRLRKSLPNCTVIEPALVEPADPRIIP